MNLSFRELDGANEDVPSINASSIEKWYHRVRDLPFEKFSVADLCRACRQKLYLEHILPFAFQCLHNNPRAGDACDGELASAIATIPTTFWKSSPVLLAEAKRSMIEALPHLDEDFNVEVKAFLYRFGENVSSFPIAISLHEQEQSRRSLELMKAQLTRLTQTKITWLPDNDEGFLFHTFFDGKIVRLRTNRPTDAAFCTVTIGDVETELAKLPSNWTLMAPRL
jgi:hypothetical protein